uniref:Uncharacterized protein n=1 Tax=Candidatus Kentrum sp. TUN TaxID=2126343 RepID=A0A450ZYA6_9GAMM|nr:MAG: hypothetical protein BECKTUN1418F_GA0071002_108610 [Candidatus Kentron sp. TUN]VFK58736.1 MAG: hypothetical protein BECKTUN1418D_GA0071000_10889 [Candidatus Kentron sp. TUN]VFK62653.1 MAG: hypothetical protein BECKTUN1418E_GA0071001_108410 [Candidatus Kentron sp. TUN]
MTKPSERPILEAILETSEVVADIVTDDQVLSGIPVIGTAFKVLKAVNAIRDRVFAAKLLKPTLMNPGESARRCFWY